jgi:hypothetical protein
MTRALQAGVMAELLFSGSRERCPYDILQQSAFRLIVNISSLQ